MMKSASLALKITVSKPTGNETKTFHLSRKLRGNSQQNCILPSIYVQKIRLTSRNISSSIHCGNFTDG